MTTAADFWHIDVRIKGEWRPTPSYERTIEAARQRADSVHHWCGARVRNVVTGACQVREPGCGWVDAEPVRQSIATPAAPRRPLRAAVHAVPSPDGIPDDQLHWWQKL